MKTLSSYFLLSLTLLMAVSCTNSEFKKTKSGLLYKIYSDGKGEPAKKGQFLKVNVTQKIRDSLMYTTEGSVPIYMPVDSPRPVYNYTEILSLLRKGDSAVVVLLADSLQHKFGGQLPPFIKKKDKMTLAFRVLDVFASENLLMADKEAETSKETANEAKTMANYIESNHINAQKTEKGTYVVVESVGDGPAVDSGKQVSVRYTGKFFPSKKQFESNMTPPGNEPFKFVIGQGAVIPGLEDGLKKFRKGGKGTLYIPAYLAYGERPGPDHKPFESLIFDIVVDDVTDAPKNAAIPAPLQRPQNMPPSQH